MRGSGRQAPGCLLVCSALNEAQRPSGGATLIEPAGASSTAPERDPPRAGGGDAQSAVATGRQPDPSLWRLAREQHETPVGKELERVGAPPFHDHRDPLRQRSDGGVARAPERSQDLPCGNGGKFGRARSGRGRRSAARRERVVGPRLRCGRGRHCAPLSGRGRRTMITGAARTYDDGQGQDGDPRGPPEWTSERKHEVRQFVARRRRCQ